MTYTVNDSCIRCKLMDCVEVCPVDCFYEGENMLVIHPDECIDCGVCEPECPVEAIKPDTEPGVEKWLSLNAEYARIWPNITGHLEKFFSPSRCESDSLIAMAMGGWNERVMGQTGFFDVERRLEAIRPDTEPGLEKWLSLNAEYAKAWPNITVKKAPPPDSKEWEG